MSNLREQAFSEAIERAGGTQSALAKLLDVAPQRVSEVAAGMRWGKAIPWKWAKIIEHKLGIDKARICPEVWGDDA